MLDVVECALLSPVYTTPQSGLNPEGLECCVKDCYLDSNLDSNSHREVG